MHRFFFILAVLLPAVFSCPVNTRAAGENLPRVIAAFYDSSEEFNRSEDNNRIHNNAEMVLNYLGFKVRYYDVQKPLPSDADLKDVYGVVAWFRDDSIPHAAEFCRKAVEWIGSGKKMVLIKNSALFRDSETLAPVDESTLESFYGALGIVYEGFETENALLIELAEKTPGLTEFERSFDGELPFYEKFSAGPGTRSWVKIRRTDLENSESPVVMTTPQGAFALEPYTLFMNPFNLKRQWRIDPFVFFDEALNTPGLPRFDTTTLLGRRIFYTHIDGDGFRNLTLFNSNRYCAESLRREILEKFGIPFSVSFITSEIDPSALGSERLVSEALAIAALPNMEAASHTFSHPLNWKKKLTAFEIPGYSTRSREAAEENEHTMRDSRYPNAAAILVPDSEYLDREIKGSTEYLNRLFEPLGKKVKILQWSGDCLPTSGALEEAKRLGLKNINGGDTRFDSRFRSYTGVAPLTRQISGSVQFYASSANENLYTNAWHGPFDGFTNVLETYRETETPSLFPAPPRRVAPINVYYHFYSAEREISLKALKTVYEQALSQDVIPVFTSEYLEMAEGFLSGTITAGDNQSWIFENYGPFGTVRFDSEKIYPDLKRSQGIWGFRQSRGVTYFHLADSGRAVLYTAETPPSEPYLKSASAILTNLSLTPERLSFSSRGFIKETFYFSNLKPEQRYEVTVTPAGSAPVKSEFRTDSAGELKLELSLKGPAAITAEAGS